LESVMPTLPGLCLCRTIARAGDTVEVCFSRSFPLIADAFLGNRTSMCKKCATLRDSGAEFAGISFRKRL